IRMCFIMSFRKLLESFGRISFEPDGNKSFIFFFTYLGFDVNLSLFTGPPGSFDANLNDWYKLYKYLIFDNQHFKHKKEMINIAKRVTLLLCVLSCPGAQFD